MIIAASCLCVRGSGEYLKTTPPYTKIKPQQLQDVNYFQNKSKSHAFTFWMGPWFAVTWRKKGVENQR